MLWFWDHEVAKWLLGLVILGTLYAGIITSFVNLRLLFKSLIVILLLVQCYLVVMLTEQMLGKPRPDIEGLQGMLAGYTVYKVNDQKRIAILMHTLEDRPITFSVPWSEKTEKDLSKSMKDLSEKGHPTGLRKKLKNESDNKDQNESGIELYNFVDGFLTQKNGNQ